MNQYYAVVFVVVLIVAAVAVVMGKVGGSRGAFRRKALMSKNEHEFFKRLIAAYPETYVFAQVGMSALIEPRAAQRSKKFLSDFRRISQKRIDYVVCNQNMGVLAIVELDDRTHDLMRDAARDAMTASAGIRTLRFQSRNKPNIVQLRAALFPNDPLPERNFASSTVAAMPMKGRSVVRDERVDAPRDPAQQASAVKPTEHVTRSRESRPPATEKVGAASNQKTGSSRFQLSTREGMHEGASYGHPEYSMLNVVTGFVLARVGIPAATMFGRLVTGLHSDGGTLVVVCNEESTAVRYGPVFKEAWSQFPRAGAVRFESATGESFVI